MIVEEEETAGIRFTVSHFYDSSIRTSWTRSAPARLKRLAQESITLSTSLPIAYGSTIFVRCDTDRLDVMKVRFGLIIDIGFGSIILLKVGVNLYRIDFHFRF